MNMEQTDDNLGYEEGETCNRNGCTGVIEWYESESGNCSCHLNAPCSACENAEAYYQCTKCDYQSDTSENPEWGEKIKVYQNMIDLQAREFIRSLNLELPKTPVYDSRYGGRVGVCLNFRYHHEPQYFCSSLFQEQGFEKIKAYYESGITFTKDRIEVNALGMHLNYNQLMQDTLGEITLDKSKYDAQMQDEIDKKATELEREKLPIWGCGRYFDQHLEVWQIRGVTKAEAYIEANKHTDGYYVKYKVVISENVCIN